MNSILEELKDNVHKFDSKQKGQFKASANQEKEVTNQILCESIYYLLAIQTFRDNHKRIFDPG